MAELKAGRSTGKVAAGGVQGNYQPQFVGDGIIRTAGLLGNELPQELWNWRPFKDEAMWNVPIDPSWSVNANSLAMIDMAKSQATNIRMGTNYCMAIWYVDTSLFPPNKYINYPDGHSSFRIWHWWDSKIPLEDNIADVPMPLAQEMWCEPTVDAHLGVVDLNHRNFQQTFGTLWEVSKYNWNNGNPQGNNFNIWNVGASGRGHGIPVQYGVNPYNVPPTRWTHQGARASGFPIIAGLVRPEELKYGLINHALAFTYNRQRGTPTINGRRQNLFMFPPACRADGGKGADGDCSNQDCDTSVDFFRTGERIQLDPTLSMQDMNISNPAAIVVATALQSYGAFLCDNGGAMAFQMQARTLDGLTPTQARIEAYYNTTFGSGFLNDVKKIKTEWFRVIDTPGSVERIFPGY